MAESTTREVERFLDLPYHIVLMRDEQGGHEAPWKARVEELPGCEAHEETPEKAVRAIEKAMERWIAAALEKGADVPEPRRPSSHSGRLLLRIPETLHADLAHRAESEDTSLNGFITGVLAGAVGWQHTGDRTAAEASASDSGTPRSRILSVAIMANIVVVLIAAIAAIVLLIVAWRHGW